MSISSVHSPYPFTRATPYDTVRQPQRGPTSSASASGAIGGDDPFQLVDSAAYAEAVARALTCTPFAVFQREWATRVQLFALNVLLVGAVVFVGLVGNILTRLILARDASRSPMNFLLQMLIAADSAFLLCSIVYQMAHPDSISIFFDTETLWSYYNFYYLYVVIPVFYFGQTVRVVRIWMTIVVAMDRYTAVSKPLQSRAILTLRRARLLSLLVVLFACAFNVPRFFDFRIVSVSLYEFQRQAGCGLPSALTDSQTNSNSSSSSPNAINESVRFPPDVYARNESLWRQLERPVAIQTPYWRANQLYAGVYHMVLMLLLVQFGPLALLLFYNTLLIVRMRQSRRERQEMLRGNERGAIARASCGSVSAILAGNWANASRNSKAAPEDPEIEATEQLDGVQHELNNAASDDTTCGNHKANKATKAKAMDTAQSETEMPASSQVQVQGAEGALSGSEGPARPNNSDGGSRSLLHRTFARAKAVLEMAGAARSRVARATATAPHAIHADGLIVIAIVTCFLLAEGPCAAVQVALTFVDTRHLHSSLLYLYAWQFGNLLVTLNCALDFAIYCLCAERFRHHLKQLFSTTRAKAKAAPPAPAPTPLPTVCKPKPKQKAAEFTCTLVAAGAARNSSNGRDTNSMALSSMKQPNAGSCDNDKKQQQISRTRVDDVDNHQQRP